MNLKIEKSSFFLISLMEKNFKKQTIKAKFYLFLEKNQVNSYFDKITYCSNLLLLTVETSLV